MNSAATQPEVLQTTLDSIAQQKRIPCATYRVQFNADFTFQDARKIVPYLHALGISDLYASPILQASPGSTHGYDICDYSRLNDALGTPEDFEALVTTLKEHGMGLVLDIVPNHMSVNIACNQWWRDVLENGPSSPYAAFFDIDWSPVKVELASKVLLPILEDQYGTVLESGKITLGFAAGGFVVQYNGMELPLTPDTYSDILREVEQNLQEQTESDDPHLQELQSILTALSYLPAYTDTQPEQVEERNREKEIIKRRLDLLIADSPLVSGALEETLQTLNGDVSDPASYDRLDNLLQQQVYRMAFWRVAADEINYRRFFDINEMAAIHIEYPEVFEAVHEKVLQLLRENIASGLRVDHPDGLWDPTRYFQALQESYMLARLLQEVPLEAEEARQVVDQWFEQRAAEDDLPAEPLYVVAEKILSEMEPLPTDWSVDGTTGYDFLTEVNSLFVDPASEERLTEIYQRFNRREMDFAEIVYHSKQLIMDEALASEIRSLSRQLERITEGSRRYRDFTLKGLTAAIREVIASLSIYRTYTIETGTVSERDQFYILEAVVNARRRNPNIPHLLFTFIRDTLLLRNLDEFHPAYRPRVVNFVMRLQQITGPVMAKSVEDTSFYIYNRLVSLNEVGGHPDQFGITLHQFHEHNQFRLSQWPHAMLTTSTHDTKRSEDVRARINVLSEIPDEWEAALQTWGRLNADKKTRVDDTVAPDANDEYLYYQTLLGVWDEAEPLEIMQERLKGYMTKATNEAKVHTSWINPEEAYNEAVHNFVQQTLADTEFMDTFRPLQQKVAHFGRLNGLSQTLLKLTVPGVPDVYQGNELWDFSLVDPDNRRAVDFEQRRERLDALLQQKNKTHLEAVAVEQSLLDGTLKLMITARTLQCRRDYPQLFEQGSYEPLASSGQFQEHVCAFIRRTDTEVMLVAVPVRCTAVTGSQQIVPTGETTWGDTTLTLPDDLTNSVLQDIFTGREISMGQSIPVGRLFESLPFALLITPE